MKTLRRLQAGEHTIRVRDWGPGAGLRMVDLHLDGFCLVVTAKANHGLVEAIAEKLQFALRAPERKRGRVRLPS